MSGVSIHGLGGSVAMEPIVSGDDAVGRLSGTRRQSWEMGKRVLFQPLSSGKGSRLVLSRRLRP